jgi:hypothetical protein
MARFNFKKLAIVSILGLFLFGMVGIVNAQQVLPKGGDSFTSAVKLEPGSYQGGSIESKEAEYFYLTGVKLGQEISLKGTFTPASSNAGAEAVLVLYDEDGTKVAEKVEAVYETVLLTVSSLHRGTETDKYYIKAGSGLFDIDSFSLEVTLKAAPPTTGAGKAVATTAPAVVVGAPKAAPSGGSNLILIVGAVVVLVVLGIAAYFLLKKKK